VCDVVVNNGDCLRDAEQFYCKLSKSWHKPEWGPPTDLDKYSIQMPYLLFTLYHLM